ncbi:glycosyltransferase family 4 protein, partial [Candidatus Collierbacteria bacterium CG10_big_fil_rev_8_21_14_0_10_44_9]
IVGPFLRHFDFQSAQRVDAWIANSQEVAKRIEKFYRKDATVIYPPIEIDSSTAARLAARQVGMTKRKDYYLMVSRIVGGKGILEAATAFKKLGIKLKIVGEIITPLENVEYVGRVEDGELPRLYAGAKGFVALARDEDFG